MFQFGILVSKNNKYYRIKRKNENPTLTDEKNLEGFMFIFFRNTQEKIDCNKISYKRNTIRIWVKWTSEAGIKSLPALGASQPFKQRKRFYEQLAANDNGVRQGRIENGGKNPQTAIKQRSLS